VQAGSLGARALGELVEVVDAKNSASRAVGPATGCPTGNGRVYLVCLSHQPRKEFTYGDQEKGCQEVCEEGREEAGEEEEVALQRNRQQQQEWRFPRANARPCSSEMSGRPQRAAPRKAITSDASTESLGASAPMPWRIAAACGDQCAAGALTGDPARGWKVGRREASKLPEESAASLCAGKGWTADIRRWCVCPPAELPQDPRILPSGQAGTPGGISQNFFIGHRGDSSHAAPQHIRLDRS
jgi:hypothetical protein